MFWPSLCRHLFEMCVIESWFLFLFSLRQLDLEHNPHTHTSDSHHQQEQKCGWNWGCPLRQGWFLALLILEFLWRRWAWKRRKTLCLGDRQLGKNSVVALPLFLLYFPFLFFFSSISSAFSSSSMNYDTADPMYTHWVRHRDTQTRQRGLK